MKNVMLLFLLLLCGCRTEYVPIESVRYDSVMIEKLMRDSVFVRDSVYLKEKGDTIYKYKDRFVYVYKNRVDTFFAEKIREIEVPVPVERKLTWWESVKLKYAEWMIGVVFVLVIIYAVRKWVLKLFRKEK
jgi:hypothetical protein